MCVAKKWKTLQTLFCVAVLIKWFCFTLKHMQYISIALLWCVTLFPQHAKRGIIIRVSRNLLLGSNTNDYIPRLVADGFLYFRIIFFSAWDVVVVSEQTSFPTRKYANCSFYGGCVHILLVMWFSFSFDLGEFSFSWVNGHIFSWFGWFVAVFYYDFFLYKFVFTV